MLLFVDGFDYYPTADINKKWSGVYSDSFSILSCVSGGRYGTGTQRLFLGNFAAGSVTKVIPSSDGVIIGWAMKWTTTGGSGIPNFLRLFAPTSQTQSILDFSGGIFTWKNGTRNNASVASLVTIIQNTWYYVEFKTKFETSSTSGSTQLRINGVVVIDVPTSTNTIGDFINSNAKCNSVQFGNPSNAVSGLSMYLDDIYIADNTGSINNNFLGDVRIETIYPTGAGSSTQFTATGAATNWEAVSETPEDGDTSYVSSNTPTFKDLYTFANLETTPTLIHGIQVSTIGRKDDAGVRVVAPIVKSGGTEYTHESTNGFGLGDGYSQHLDVWELNPDGNVAWTGTTVDALTGGVKIIT